MKHAFAEFERPTVPHGRAVFEAKGFGELYLAWTRNGLSELWLPGRWQWLEDAAFGPEAKLPAAWRKTLSSYFAGKAVDFRELPVDLHGTTFQKKVWRELRKIPHGRVRSYGAIARSIRSPQAMRAVGGANGANPVAIVVPCHRVVREGNALGGYTGGVAFKRQLLELEGMQVEAGRVLPGQLGLLDTP